MVGDKIGDMVQNGVVQTVALKRLATSEEMANVFLFLASDETSFIA